MTTRTEEDREFAAVTDKEIWLEARDRLQICIEAESDNRSRAKEAMLFREGPGQWDDAGGESGIDDTIELTINLTDAMVERVENNIRQQRPRGKVHPVGDGADIEVAEVINGIGRHVEIRSEAGIAYDTAASCALDGGWGYFRMFPEFLDPRSFQKDLRIQPIRNPFTVYMDPGAIMPHGGDQNWCLLSVKQKRQEYRRRHPSAENAAWSDMGIGDGLRDWDSKEEIRLAEYFRIREKPEMLYLMRDAQGQEFTKYLSEMPRSPETGKLLTIDEARLRLAALQIDIIDDRPSVKRQVEWFRINGLKVIEKQQLPGMYIPVFRVEGKSKDIDGQVRRRGMVEGMMDPQRMVNYGEVAKIKRLGLTPQAPWVAAEGQLDGHPEWDNANQKSHAVLTYKPVTIQTSNGEIPLPPPQRQQPAQLEQGFSEFTQGMRSNLMALAGMPNEPGQDEQGQVVSGRAIQRRQFLSDQSHFRYYDNLTLAIAQCWRCMVPWIQVYFSEERMQRIIGEDSTPQMVKVNEKGTEPDDDGNPVAKVKNDLSIGTYDIVMDTGPGYETKREEGADNMIDLMKVGPLAEIIAKTGADLVFRAIDHPYMQELADRLQATNPDGLEKIMEGLSSRAKSIVQALQKQVDALKQENETLQQDLKGGITKAHLAAVTKAHDTEVKARTAIHDVDSRDRTKLDVAEIQAASHLIDSRVANKHESDMAERDMLHTAGEAERDRQFTSSESAADRIMQASQQQEAQGQGAQQ